MVDRRRLVHLVELGMRDAQIADALACHRSTVHRARAQLDLPRRPRPHGTRATYKAGCRCQPCTIANRAYQREYRS